MPQIEPSLPRKLLYTLHDYLVGRLADGGWSSVTVLVPNEEWPEDKKLVILAQGQTLQTGEVALPAVKLNMDDTIPDGDLQIGGSVEKEIIPCDIEFVAKTNGQLIDLKEFLRTSFADVVLYLLDYKKYPDTNPTPLFDVRIEDVTAITTINYGTDNAALRNSGIVRFTVGMQRSRSIHTNRI